MQPTLTIWVLVLSGLVSIAIPAVVALVTAREANPSIKSIILLALAAVNGLLTQALATPGGFAWKPAILLAIYSYIMAIAAHFGFLKPVSITGSAGLIQKKAPLGIK